MTGNLDGTYKFSDLTVSDPLLAHHPVFRTWFSSLVWSAYWFEFYPEQALELGLFPSRVPINFYYNTVSQ